MVYDSLAMLMLPWYRFHSLSGVQGLSLFPVLRHSHTSSMAVASCFISFATASAASLSRRGLKPFGRSFVRQPSFHGLRVRSLEGQYQRGSAVQLRSASLNLWCSTVPFAYCSRVSLPVPMVVPALPYRRVPIGPLSAASLSSMRLLNSCPSALSRKYTAKWRFGCSCCVSCLMRSPFCGLWRV